jgi:uncharacterized protein (TIGR03118 family)
MRLLSLIAFTAIPVVWAGPLGFSVKNLASDQAGVAPVTDPKLVNAWGIAAGPTTPPWINAEGTDTSLVYTGAGVKLPLEVSVSGGPTGIAFSGVTGSFNDNLFLFASEDGTVSGWRGSLGTTAEVLLGPDPDNIYLGMAQATIGGTSYAYLANFHSGAIDVLKGNAGAPNLTGSFTAPGLPAGYAPFNIANLGGMLYVAYALQDAAAEEEVAGAGLGIVNRFDLNGNFLGPVVGTGSALNAPWGLAIAPSSGFQDVSGALLVGNFGDGRINAYDPITGAFIKTLTDTSGNPIEIDGLWGLQFGNGSKSGGSKQTLYFTAGPEDELHGLFGQITAVPEPGMTLLTALGLAAAVAVRRYYGKG